MDGYICLSLLKASPPYLLPPGFVTTNIWSTLSLFLTIEFKHFCSVSVPSKETSSTQGTQFRYFFQMANSLCFAPVCSLAPPSKPGVFIGNSVGGQVLRVQRILRSSSNSKFRSLEAKAASGNQSTKPNSIVCANCDGNGAVQCNQCKGSGVNSVDHFNGQFKAGGLCWLCRGKKEMLCGDCNGAGFIGGFMSTFDD